MGYIQLWAWPYFAWQVAPETSRNPSQPKLFDSPADFWSMKFVLMTRRTFMRLHGLEELPDNSGLPWTTATFMAWASKSQPTNYPQICFLLTHPQSFPLQQISPSFNDAFYREWEEGPKAVFRFKLQMAPWMSNKPLQWALFPHSSLVWSFSSPPTPQDACVVFWWDLDMHLFIFLTEW